MDGPLNLPGGGEQNGHRPEQIVKRRVMHSDSDSDSEDEPNTYPTVDLQSVNANEQEPKIFGNITIEPIMLLHMIGYAGSSVVVQNMYLDRICRLTLHFNATVCANPSDYGQAIENSIESHAAIYTTYRGLIEAGFPILFSLFLGPWTDVHGTKYPILFPLLGFFMSALTYLVLTFAHDLPPAYILLSSIPVALTGGMVAMVMSVFSYMAKITTVENRSFRVAMLEASWFVGGPIGLVSGGYIYKYGDFHSVFITSAILYAIAFVYGVIVVKEEMPNRPEDEIRHCCTDMFNVQAVKVIFATIAVDRPGKSRRWMHIMLITICLRIFIMMGYLNTMYLYTRNKFGWNLTNYTEYSVADSFIAITGTYIMVMITLRIFKLNDSIIGIIGSVGSVVGSIIFATASASWMIYLGAVMSMFAGLISIIIRSMLSKIVAKEEIAKVFTFLACGEASMPLIAVPIYNLVFVSTINTFPGAVFLISTGIYVLILIAFVYLYISMRDYTPHEEMSRSEHNEAEA